MVRMKTAILAGTTLATVGCIGPPAKLDLKSSTPAKIQVSESSIGSRAVVLITRVEDARQDKESLGSVAGRTFGNTPLEPWVEQELLGMGTGLFVAVTKPLPNSPASLHLKARILKAYLSGLSTSKTAAVVIECEFITPTGSGDTRIYRGQYQSLNWNSNEDEATNAIRQALNRCVDKIRADLDARIAKGQQTPANPS